MHLYTWYELQFPLYLQLQAVAAICLKYGSRTSKCPRPILTYQVGQCLLQESYLRIPYTVDQALERKENLGGVMLIAALTRYVLIKDHQRTSFSKNRYEKREAKIWLFNPIVQANVTIKLQAQLKVTGLDLCIHASVCKNCLLALQNRGVDAICTHHFYLSNIRR